MSSGNNKIISCLCGGIQLKTKGPLRHVSNCHCRQCMKTHGNYAAYTNALEKDIKFIKKRTLKWFKSSKKARRGFCNKCGASIFFKFLGSMIKQKPTPQLNVLSISLSSIFCFLSHLNIFEGLIFFKSISAQ